MKEIKKEKESVRKRKAEEATQRALALNVAKEYCQKHNLSYEKLLEQRFSLEYGTAWFSQPSSVKPLGLTNDLATQPMPTLVLKSNNDILTIEETEHTRKYLTQ